MTYEDQLGGLAHRINVVKEQLEVLIDNLSLRIREIEDASHEQRLALLERMVQTSLGASHDTRNTPQDRPLARQDSTRGGSSPLRDDRSGSPVQGSSGSDIKERGGEGEESEGGTPD